jgi:hypothetical protein
MVKAADNRATKYAAKFDPTVVSSRFTALKSYSSTEFAAAAATYASLETTIKGAIEAKVPSPTLMPFYLAFGRQVYSKAQRYSGLTLFNEAMAAKAVWTARGLDAGILTDIMNICGVSTALYGS